MVEDENFDSSKATYNVSRIETMFEEDFQKYFFYAKVCYLISGFAKSCSRSLNRFNFLRSKENTKFDMSYMFELLPKRTTTVKTLDLNQKARTRDIGVFFPC